MTLTLDTVTSAEGFDALAPEWDDLVRAMPRPSPFLLHGWLRAWWRHYGAGAELTVHVARRGRRLVGAFPLYVGRRGRLRVTEFLGADEAHLGDLLLARGEETELADAIAARARGTGDLLSLFGLPACGRAERALAGQRLAVRERVDAPVLDLDGDWERTYRRVASAKTRQTHRRKLRRLAELGSVEFALARTPSEIEAVLGETFRLHRLRWEGRRDGSRIGTPAGRAFQLDGYRALAKEGVARILTLNLGERAIAYNALMVLEGRLYSHRLGFDPDYARWSAGLLCTLEMCALAADEGLSRIEFLGGNEDYKLMLADRCEPLHQGIGLASSLRGRLAVGRELAGLRGRRRLKRMPGLQRLYVEGLPRRRHAGRSRPAALSA